MPYEVGALVKLNTDYTATSIAGSGGKVLKQNQNGKYRVKVTHKPDGVPLDTAEVLPSVKEADLSRRRKLKTHRTASPAPN